MADKLSRQPQNLPEPWYMDTTCAKTWPPQSGPWTFARLWQSETTDEICDADESPLQELL